MNREIANIADSYDRKGKSSDAIVTYDENLHRENDKLKKQLSKVTQRLDAQKEIIKELMVIKEQLGPLIALAPNLQELAKNKDSIVAAGQEYNINQYYNDQITEQDDKNRGYVSKMSERYRSGDLSSDDERYVPPPPKDWKNKFTPFKNYH